MAGRFGLQEKGGLRPVVVMRPLRHHTQKASIMRKIFRHARVLAAVLSCLAAATTIAKNLDWLGLWPR